MASAVKPKPGCGFPHMRLVGCFSLHTGGLLSYASGNKHDAELSIFRQQLDECECGDILLADRGFCNCLDLSRLKKRGVDSVMRLRGNPFKKTSIIRRLGEDDYLVKWQRPKKRSPSCTPEEWEQLPEHIIARQITLRVDVPGFRSQEIVLVTTLTDPEAYLREELGDLCKKALS